MIKTVGELKKFLENIPDDALIYEQLTKKGKHLEAVDPNIHYENSIWEDNYLTDFESGYNVITYYEFPDFIQVPITTEPILDYLKRMYDGK